MFYKNVSLTVIHILYIQITFHILGRQNFPIFFGLLWFFSGKTFTNHHKPHHYSTEATQYQHRFPHDILT